MNETYIVKSRFFAIGTWFNYGDKVSFPDGQLPDWARRRLNSRCLVKES